MAFWLPWCRSARSWYFSRNQQSASSYTKEVFIKETKMSFFMNKNGRTWKLSFLFTRRLSRMRKEQNKFKRGMEKLFLPRLWQTPWFSASEPLTPPLCTLYFFYGHHAVRESVITSKFALFFSFNIFLIKRKNLSTHTGKA